MTWGSQVVQKSRSGSLSSLKLTDLRPILQSAMNSNYTDFVTSLVILTNVVFVGVEVEMQAQTKKEEVPEFMQVISLLYCVIFTIEIVLRFLVECHQFFWKPNWAWNFFDTFVVVVSWLEIGVGVDVAGTRQLSSLRVIKMARVVRVLRIARVMRHVRSLRILVHSVMNTIRSLVWTLVLLAMILYVFGLLFAQAASQYIMDPANKTIVNLDEAYGNVGRSVFSLFKAISGGVSWEQVVEPLQELHYVWLCFYLVYFAFTYFAVLNVVTGVFCQTAIESATMDQETAAQAHMNAEQQHVRRLHNLFKTINKSQTGMITLQELEDCMQDEKLRAYFSSLDLSMDEAFSLFKLLDHNNAHILDIDKFVKGCLKLRGTAKSLDIAMMMYETRWSLNKFSQRMKHIESAIEEKSVHSVGCADSCDASSCAQDEEDKYFETPSHF